MIYDKAYNSDLNIFNKTIQLLIEGSKRAKLHSVFVFCRSNVQLALINHDAFV